MTKRKYKPRKPHKTRKHKRPNGICGSIISNHNGWKTLYVYGDAYERGYAHGYLLYDELKKVLKLFPFVLKEQLKTTMKEYIKKSNELIKPVIIRDFQEIYQEMEGISAGARYRGTRISVDYLIAWNSYMSLYTMFNRKKNGNLERCSAFIATGDATKDGKIVMGHTTHCDFITGSLYNINLYMIPTTGHPFVMQISPGFVASVSDFFISSSGIIGCETTISATNYQPKFGAPFFCRIRTAMQYCHTLDQYVKMMLTDNAGDYACSWQFGNIHTNEIMLFELLHEHHSIKRTTDGVYYGMNSAIDPDLRLTETNDGEYNDITKSSGARNYRLNHLLNDEYYGKIDIHTAKLVLSDHYDMDLNRIKKDTLSVCKHTELDPHHSIKRPGYYPFGCIDGKITTTDLAKKMQFVARFGSACGRKFSAKDHIQKHPEYKSWKPFLSDFPKYPWTKIEITSMDYAKN